MRELCQRLRTLLAKRRERRETAELHAWWNMATAILAE